MDKLTHYRHVIPKNLTEYEALASQTPNKQLIDSEKIIANQSWII